MNNSMSHGKDRGREAHLLMPTGAGVREPQNRRVEIIIR